MTENRYRVNFAKLKTPNLSAYAIAANFSGDAYRTRAKSKPRKLVDGACKNEVETITAIIAAHNLEEMIAPKLRLQTNDLEKYAHYAAEVKGVEQGLADLQSGIHMYAMPITDPEQHRELAKGFTDRNRGKRLDVPKDGMRYALSSQDDPPAKPPLAAIVGRGKGSPCHPPRSRGRHQRRLFHTPAGSDPR